MEEDDVKVDVEVKDEIEVKDGDDVKVEVKVNNEIEVECQNQE